MGCLSRVPCIGDGAVYSGSSQKFVKRRQESFVGLSSLLLPTDSQAIIRGFYAANGHLLTEMRLKRVRCVDSYSQKTAVNGLLPWFAHHRFNGLSLIIQ